MELQRPAARPAWWRASLRARRACHRKVQNNPGVMVLRHLQWNRATAIRCRGWSRGAHAPSRAAVDASSTAPTRASARGPRLAGNPRFWDEPGQSSSRRFPNRRAVVFQKRMLTGMRPASHWLPPLRPQNSTENREEPASSSQPVADFPRSIETPVPLCTSKKPLPANRKGPKGSKSD